MAICSHHLEEVLKADAHSVTVCNADENCPITAAVANALPERSFLSSVAGGAADKENYIAETLSVADEFITVYRHESLTSEQVLDLFVKHYKAWYVNRPDGRH